MMTDDRPGVNRCRCHGKTEAEIAAPYALFVFGMSALAIFALLIAVVFG